jgi:hypothetical protein
VPKNVETKPHEKNATMEGVNVTLYRDEDGALALVSAKITVQRRDEGAERSPKGRDPIGRNDVVLG